VPRFVRYFLVAVMLPSVALLLGADSSKPSEPDALKKAIYLANNTTGEQVVLGGCDQTADLSVAPGRVGRCRSEDPTTFLLSLPGGETVTLDVTQEGNFEVEISGNSVRGALETAAGLLGVDESYYVFVWVIEESEP